MIMNGCKPMPPITELGQRARTLTPRDRARPVVLREKPDGDSPVVGSLRVGEAALFDAECGEYVRTAAAPVGWALSAALSR